MPSSHSITDLTSVLTVPEREEADPNSTVTEFTEGVNKLQWKCMGSVPLGVAPLA